MFPKGISEVEAKTILKEKGLEVSLLESENAVNHMLVGTIRERKKVWTIGISILDGKVVGHSVNITN